MWVVATWVRSSDGLTPGLRREFVDADIEHRDGMRWWQLDSLDIEDLARLRELVAGAKVSEVARSPLRADVQPWFAKDCDGLLAAIAERMGDLESGRECPSPIPE
jgi:hypothetical protein